ncbi:MAG TPA: NAD(P)/FAD-dependent oxidoreductase [Terriglobales bacterium]|nr:NAD(P)/FAD-dependent oxidoreductase [Terriglobales bacterium]
MGQDSRQTEVVVVGGGPSGLAAAIAICRSGFEVTVIDPAQPPIDKVCGEGVMPDGLAILADLGISLPQADTAAFRGIRFLDSERSVEAEFVRGVGLGIRRTVLHQALVDHAARAGVQLRWGVRATGIRTNAVQLDGGELSCRWIIGADGLKSNVRTWLGLGSGLPEAFRFGYRRHFAVKPWSDFVEVHWTALGQLYVTPVSGGEICVALVTRQRNVRMEEAIAACRTLPESVKQATRSGREQGAITANRKLDAVVKGQCALIGEASGCVDAVTGEGLSLAFRQALALEHALRHGDLHLYQYEHRRLMRLPTAMASLMLLMDRRPGIQRRALRALSNQPELFGRMLAVHTGDASAFSIGWRGPTNLAWQMLTA